MSQDRQQKPAMEETAVDEQKDCDKDDKLASANLPRQQNKKKKKGSKNDNADLPAAVHKSSGAISGTKEHTQDMESTSLYKEEQQTGTGAPHSQSQAETLDVESKDRTQIPLEDRKSDSEHKEQVGEPLYERQTEELRTDEDQQASLSIDDNPAVVNLARDQDRKSKKKSKNDDAALPAAVHKSSGTISHIKEQTEEIKSESLEEQQAGAGGLHTQAQAETLDDESKDRTQISLEEKKSEHKEQLGEPPYERQTEELRTDEHQHACLPTGTRGIDYNPARVNLPREQDRKNKKKSKNDNADPPAAVHKSSGAISHTKEQTDQMKRKSLLKEEEQTGAGAPHTQSQAEPLDEESKHRTQIPVQDRKSDSGNKEQVGEQLYETQTEELRTDEDQPAYLPTGTRGIDEHGGQESAEFLEREINAIAKTRSNDEEDQRESATAAKVQILCDDEEDKATMVVQEGEQKCGNIEQVKVGNVGQEGNEKDGLKQQTEIQVNIQYQTVAFEPTGKKSVAHKEEQESDAALVLNPQEQKKAQFEFTVEGLTRKFTTLDLNPERTKSDEDNGPDKQQKEDSKMAASFPCSPFSGKYKGKKIDFPTLHKALRPRDFKVTPVNEDEDSANASAPDPDVQGARQELMVRTTQISHDAHVEAKAEAGELKFDEQNMSDVEESQDSSQEPSTSRSFSRKEGNTLMDQSQHSFPEDDNATISEECIAEDEEFDVKKIIGSSLSDPLKVMEEGTISPETRSDTLSTIEYVDEQADARTVSKRDHGKTVLRQSSATDSAVGTLSQVDDITSPSYSCRSTSEEAAARIDDKHAQIETEPSSSTEDIPLREIDPIATVATPQELPGVNYLSRIPLDFPRVLPQEERDESSRTIIAEQERQRQLPEQPEQPEQQEETTRFSCCIFLSLLFLGFLLAAFVLLLMHWAGILTGNLLG